MYSDLRDPILDTDPMLHIAQTICSTGVMSMVSFGRYPQEKGKEPSPIRWLVLQRDDSSLTLLSRDALACQKYNTAKRVDWSSISLRRWLNDEFLQTAFTDAEAAFLKPVSFMTEVKNRFIQPPSVVMQDKVFLLSTAEAKALPSRGFSLAVDATDYARSMYAATNSSMWDDGEIAKSWWWLLTNDRSAKCAPMVTDKGNVVEDHVYDCRKMALVRPAIVLQFPDPKGRMPLHV